MDLSLTSPELTKLKKALSLYHSQKKQIIGDPIFYDPERDGVTYSVLSTFRRCRELSRLGLKGVTARTSSNAIVFGETAHGVLQAVYTAIRRRELTAIPARPFIQNVLDGVETTWKRDNPRASADTLRSLEYSMIVSEAVLPAYFRYWGDIDLKVKWLNLEHEFKIPVTIPLKSGRVVRTFVRGKMDGNFREKRKLKLLETKTKSRIDDGTLADILPHELQVNTYLWAMRKLWKETPTAVRYNLIRRPGLYQRKNEDLRQFAVRCAEDVKLRPDFYFIRLDLDVDKAHVQTFHYELMELIQDFLAWWYGEAGHYKNSDQCENKYGKCPMLAWCGRRDNLGLYKRPTVFRELEEM